MPNVIEHRKFVCYDGENNNAKFWEYKLFDNDTYVAIYGRIGKTRTEDPPKNKSDLAKKIREKTNGRGKEGSPSYKAPYKEIAILDEGVISGPSGPDMSKAAVKEAAISQLAKKDVELVKLVERLVEANKHELHKATGGNMSIDSSGLIKTAMGVVTKDNINQARVFLNELSPYVQSQDFDNKTFIKTLDNYLMLIPQQVAHGRGWYKYFLTDDSRLQAQNSLLDQLDASADMAQARKEAAIKGAVAQNVAAAPELFNTDLKLVTDPKIIKMIEKMYFDNVNSRHESAHLKPIRFYEVLHKGAHDAFQNDGAKLGNIQLLWHGTRVFNVLSILKNFLIVPKSGGSIHVTGRLFGDGLYFSDQSSKSLNYAYGYWDRGSRDNNCFMFLADVAMGNPYTPRASYETLPKAGYDSTFAIGGKSGVMNNEMIVYRTSQANLRYLIEFDKK